MIYQFIRHDTVMLREKNRRSNPESNLRVNPTKVGSSMSHDLTL